MRGADVRRIVSAVKRRAWSRRELRIYVCSAEQVHTLPRASHCRRDHWDDLRFCDQWSFDDLTREQYLAILEQRRQAGIHHLYSLVENQILVHYGWVTYPQERAPDAALGLEFIPPPGSAALWDYFTHPAARGRGLYLHTLWQCLHDAIELDGARQAFIYVYADNAISRHVIEKAGFRYRGSLVLQYRLFTRRRYATFVGDPLDVRLLGSGRPAHTRQERRPVVPLEHREKGNPVVQDSNGTAGEHQLQPRSPRQESV